MHVTVVLSNVTGTTIVLLLYYHCTTVVLPLYYRCATVVIISPHLFIPASQSNTQHTPGQNRLLKSIHKARVLEKEIEEVDLEQQLHLLKFEIESEEAEVHKQMSLNASSDLETMKETMETRVFHDQHHIASLRKKKEAGLDLFASVKKNKVCRKALDELDKQVKDDVQALEVHKPRESSWLTGMVWGRKEDAPPSPQVKDGIKQYLEDVQISPRKNLVQEFDAIPVVEEDQKVSVCLIAV